MIKMDDFTFENGVLKHPLYPGECLGEILDDRFIPSVLLMGCAESFHVAAYKWMQIYTKNIEREGIAI